MNLVDDGDKQVTSAIALFACLDLVLVVAVARDPQPPFNSFAGSFGGWLSAAPRAYR